MKARLVRRGTKWCSSSKTTCRPSRLAEVHDDGDISCNHSACMMSGVANALGATMLADMVLMYSHLALRFRPSRIATPDSPAKLGNSGADDVP
jgi:hypothetical protein